MTERKLRSNAELILPKDLTGQVAFQNPSLLVGFDGSDFYLGYIDSEGGLRNRNQVWDADTLDWVAMIQPVVNTDTLTVSGSMSVTNFPATYPVTDNAGSLTVDGTVAISETTTPKLKIYSDASYDYFCKAAAGSGLGSAVWQINRMDADGSIDQADGNSNYDNLATNLATVAGLSYS